MQNPLASAAANGVMDASPVGCLDQAFIYTYNVTLTALQTLSSQTTSILTTADFVWRGLLFSSTGTFSVRFQDGQQYYLSNDFIFSSNLPNTAGDPFPFFPQVFYPAGGKIVLDIQDTSNAGNTIQISFMGASRYVVSKERGL